MDHGKPVGLVTGASTGIGRAAAIALAAAGYEVVINYSRSKSAEEEVAARAKEKGAKVLLFQCDVSDDACVREMVKAAEAEFGRLDDLVNNAGVTSNVKPKDFEAMTAEEWDRVFAVNVRGVFQLHKGYVFWELSRWAPKYFPPQLKADIRSRLQDKILFGSDYPSIPFARLFRKWDELGYSDTLKEAIFHGNAERILNLKPASSSDAPDIHAS